MAQEFHSWPMASGPPSSTSSSITAGPAFWAEVLVLRVSGWLCCWSDVLLLETKQLGFYESTSTRVEGVCNYGAQSAVLGVYTDRALYLQLYYPDTTRVPTAV
jgi:hypothetical protein